MKYYNCTDCKLQKPKQQFSKTDYSKSGIQNVCKSCKRIRKNRDYPHKSYGWKTQLKTLYGITAEQYETMYKEQNGVCAICGNINTDGYRLFVDHDHITKNVRGLLCRKCNMAIGVFDKDISLFYKAADYVEGFPIQHRISKTMKSFIDRPKHDGENV